MIPPFAVSFSSSLRTSTRSCRGVILAVISLTSVQFIPKLEQTTFYGSRATLRMKTLPILLPHCFEVFRFFILTLRFSLRPLLLVEFHGFGNGKFSFCIRSLRIDNQTEPIGKRRPDKIEGIV